MENKSKKPSAERVRSNISKIRIAEGTYKMDSPSKTIKIEHIKDKKTRDNRSIKNDLFALYSKKKEINTKTAVQIPSNTMIQPLELWKVESRPLKLKGNGNNEVYVKADHGLRLIKRRNFKSKKITINKSKVTNGKVFKTNKVSHQSPDNLKKPLYINKRAYAENAKRLKKRKAQETKHIRIRSKNVDINDIQAIQNTIKTYEYTKSRRVGSIEESKAVEKKQGPNLYIQHKEENHIKDSTTVIKSRTIRNTEDARHRIGNQIHDCAYNERQRLKGQKSLSINKTKHIPNEGQTKSEYYGSGIKHGVEKIIQAIATTVKSSSKRVLILALAFCGIVICIYPILMSVILGLNSFYFDSGGKSSKEDESIAIKMATKMNKLNADYWSGVEGAIVNRKELEGMEGFHTDLDIPEYSKVSIKFYDAFGKELDLDDTTNNKAILSLASCYQMDVDSPKQSLDYQDYCTFLWIASHDFRLEESEPYQCGNNGYEIETSDQSNPPDLPEEYFFREDVEGGLDELPGEIWCEHGHWAISEIIPHEHEDNDGNTYYTYTYMWEWLCDQHINSIMSCYISNLNSPLDDPEFDLAKEDERIFEADFIGSYLTNDIIEEYCDEDGLFDVDAWITEYKPKNFDLIKTWLEESGNNVPDLKEYICSKVRGSYDIKGEGAIEVAKTHALNNPFCITAYADPMYGAYMWKGWTDDMKDLVKLRQEKSYESVKQYDNLLSNKSLGSGASIDDYTTIVTLINSYYSSGQINKRQQEIMKLALASVGRIPYYYGGGHPGGGSGQINGKYVAEGDLGSYRSDAPDPAMAIPAETFFKVVGTDWYKRIQRGLDCSSYVWFLYASAGCPMRNEVVSTADIRDIYPTTHNPRPCDLFVIKGHVMIYLGTMNEATEGSNTDKTPYFIELTGSSKYAVDTVRIRYGLSDIPSRRQTAAKFIEGNEDSEVAYIYKDMSKYYDKPLIE